MLRNILPQPKPNPKKVNFRALTWTDPIIFYPIRTGLKCFIINPKLHGFRLQQTCEYDQKWSHNILQQHTNQRPILAVLTLVGNARHSFHLLPLYFWNSQKTPTWTGPKSLSLTQSDPKIFPKTCPDPGLVYVQSSPVRGNSGFMVALRSLIHVLPEIICKKNL